MNERIERLINESTMSDNGKEDVKKLFERLWYQYYVGGMDTHFISLQLRRMWFCYKIMMLIDLTAEKDKKAKVLLAKELNANANAYVNENHVIKEFV